MWLMRWRIEWRRREHSNVFRLNIQKPLPSPYVDDTNHHTCREMRDLCTIHVHKRQKEKRRKVLYDQRIFVRFNDYDHKSLCGV